MLKSDKNLQENICATKLGQKSTNGQIFIKKYAVYKTLIQFFLNTIYMLKTESKNIFCNFRFYETLKLQIV